MRRLIGLVLIGVALQLSACSQKSGEVPRIRYGNEPCADCRMIIGEERFAAVLVQAKDEIYKFDDIGCLKHFVNERSLKSFKVWVHDELSGRWMDGVQAYLVQSGDIVSPMGYGIVAFSSQEKAQEFARKHHGEIVSI